MATTVFSDVKAPFIDTLTTRRIVSQAVKENIFQSLFTKPNEAVTEKYSEDTDASELVVLRQKPTQNDARELGSETNGAWFNSEKAAISATSSYPIRILQTIDRNVDIPTNAQEMVAIDLLEGETRNLAGLVSRNINAVTIAAQLAKNFNCVAGFDYDEHSGAFASVTPTTKNWVIKSSSYTDAIIDAGAMLDDGNPGEDIDAYPDDMRAVFIRPAIKAEILKNMTGLYGGTSVFGVLQKGGLDTETAPAVATTGFVGEIAGMPVYVASATTWKLVELYLGLDVGALKDVAAVVVSGIGTGRALAFNNKIKTIDAPDGQGIRLQPKYRFGVECWDALSVVPVFTQTFENPVTSLETALRVRGPASRAV